MGWPIWLAALLSSVLTLPALSRSLASLLLVSAPEGCGSAWQSGAPEGRASVPRARALGSRPVFLLAFAFAFAGAFAL